MNMTSTIVPQRTLDSLLQLLQYAVHGHDNESQRRVYEELGSIEEDPSSYLGFAIIASSTQVDPQLRLMALITLKSSLGRNQNDIEFTPQQMHWLKKSILQASNSQDLGLRNAQKSLISSLCRWKRQVDYEILAKLVDGLESAEYQWAIEIIHTFLEDIRYDTENMPLYESPDFGHFVTIYTEAFGRKIGNADEPFAIKLLGCMTLIIKYTDAGSEIRTKYLQSYLIPILRIPNISNQIIIQIFDGLTELIQSGSTLLIEDGSSLATIVNYHITDLEVKKRWVSLLLDIIEADSSENEYIKSWLPTIVPLLLPCLLFTHQDDKNVKMEIEEEVNPYKYEEREEDDDYENYEGGRGYDGGYTLRRLAVMSLERLIYSFTEEVWPICQPLIQNSLSNSDPAVLMDKQSAILLVGIIFDKIVDHLDFLEQALPLIVQMVNAPNMPDIIRCTSLWTISKVAALIVKDPVIQCQVESVLIRCLEGEQNQSQDKRKVSQVKHTAYSTLDEIVSESEQLPPRLNDIVGCLQKGIASSYGHALNSVLKICSTLYRRHSQNIPPAVTILITQRLCEKWSHNISRESVMCPILECLVTIASNNHSVFANFSREIFTQNVNLLLSVSRKGDQKALLLRAVDLLSAIIALRTPAVIEFIQKQAEFHESIVYPLVVSEDREVKNFGYGLVGDICKCTPMPQFADVYAKAVAGSFDKNNLTACSNALTCLTDLIVVHPEGSWVKEYGSAAMSLAVEKLAINNLPQIYAFNYARIFGRLGAILSQQGAAYLPHCMRAVSLALRAREHQQLTNDAYKGIFNMLMASSSTSIPALEYLVESYICYDSQDPSLDSTFAQILRAYKQSKNMEEWRYFLSRPNFLPAVVRKIQALTQ